MKNETYIFNGLINYPIIETGFNKAIDICKSKNIHNIKLIVPNFGILDGEISFVVQYLSKRNTEESSEVFKKIKKRAYRLEQDEIGINIMSAHNLSIPFDRITLLLTLNLAPDMAEKIKKSILGVSYPCVFCKINSFEKSEFGDFFNNLNIVNEQDVP